MKELCLNSGCAAIIAMVCAFPSSACDRAGVAADTYVARDSAGIRIVESSAPTWEAGEGWLVDSIPELDLSEADDDELHRVSSARVLSDGRIVFFNGGSCEVRFHAESGEHLHSSGRCGAGPGEFDGSASIWLWRGDSILVVDRLTRVTVLAQDGSHGRTLILQATSDMPLPLVRGVIQDGTLMLAGLRNPSGRMAPGIEAGQSSLALLDVLDGTPRPLGTFAGPIFEYTEYNGSIGRGALAFSSATEFAAGERHVYAGFPDRFEIHAYDAEGELDRILRRAHTPVPVEQRDIDWLMERRVNQVEGEENKRVVRQAYRNLEHAKVMPAFGPPVWPGGSEGGPAMLADHDGNLWVFETYRPGEYRNEWTVFSTEGVWLGRVVLPARLTPAQVGRDFVLGRWVDSDGFAHIRKHALRK
jgi:hypothetical protein